MPIESWRDPTRALSTTNTDQPSSEPYDIKLGIQNAVVSMQGILIMSILNFIYSSSSSKISTQTRQQGSMRISHIAVLRVYCETCALLSRTNLQIYNEEEL